MAVKISGGDKMRAALEKLSQKVKSGATVEVGFFDKSQPYKKGASVPQVATWTEFGTATAPPRPFMRNTIANNSGDWGAELEVALKGADFDAKKALARVGMVIEGQIRDEIAALDAPPNAPLTNLLKDRFPTGSYTTEDFLKAVHDLKKGATAPPGKPLVWSGKLFRDVASQVKDGTDES
ncbi:hypothetical protein ASY01nite_13990 [Acetobacter syzygii]|uniref:hypothetical protein n=1 Tax=Acetobacter syzygii TaxID=146476 RepID=UPI0005E47946|nr:hypothetical protein [Acetobacter syzygii]GAN72113.1 hypothetical protein Absy_030_021 [Acetobacter syzygii]GBR64923.1 hypothetical protein AA0483_1602 [Acetobacter syzygii NRIC 0483]GEL56333.1 hypothetical protein ASY01nite_13990 [Acetobacter syzygii]